MKIMFLTPEKISLKDRTKINLLFGKLKERDSLISEDGCKVIRLSKKEAQLFLINRIDEIKEELNAKGIDFHVYNKLYYHMQYFKRIYSKIYVDEITNIFAYLSNKECKERKIVLFHA